MNINIIPFRQFRLRIALGPANPRLINSAEEPWPLRWCGFSPHCAATLPKTLISIRSTRPQSLASTQTLRRVTTSSFDGLKYRYPILAPSLFPARKPRPVICYELFQGWLPLSPPSGCFRPRTRFVCDT